MAGARGVVRVAPQRVVVADAVRVVADVVARGLMAPRLGGVFDFVANALAQGIEALLRDLGKRSSAGGGHVGISLGVDQAAAARCSWSRSALRWTLPAGVFGNSSTNTTWRGYSCWLSRLRTRSWISLMKGSPPGRPAPTKALTTWPRSGSGTPNAAASRPPGGFRMASPNSQAPPV